MTEGVRDSTSAHFGDRSGMAPRRAAPALLRCSAAGRRFPFGSEKFRLGTDIRRSPADRRR
jgi:hypothetical protein